MLFFPYIASLVAVAVVWMAIFNPDKGPINQLLIRIGVTNPPRWAASQKWAMPTIIGLTVWKKYGILYDCVFSRIAGCSKRTL